MMRRNHNSHESGVDMVGFIVIHVLSAVLGLGPAFAFPWMLREAATVMEMKKNVEQVAFLELFPKLFGTVAVLSGLALFFTGSYGSFTQLWLLGTLLIFIAIEILVIGFMAPATKALLELTNEVQSADALKRPADPLLRLYGRVRKLHVWSGVLGLVIFILMIAKPQ
jgi:uncharacterized membrane protein